MTSYNIWSRSALVWLRSRYSPSKFIRPLNKMQNGLSQPARCHKLSAPCKAVRSTKLKQTPYKFSPSRIVKYGRVTFNVPHCFARYLKLDGLVRRRKHFSHGHGLNTDIMNGGLIEAPSRRLRDTFSFFDEDDATKTHTCTHAPPHQQEGFYV